MCFVFVLFLFSGFLVVVFFLRRELRGRVATASKLLWKTAEEQEVEEEEEAASATKEISVNAAIAVS